MKRNLKLFTTILAASAALIFLAVGCAPQRQYVGAGRARELALKAAGLTEADVQADSTDMVNQGGVDSYQVAITAGGQTHTFNVDALSGEVEKVSAEPAQPVQAPAEEPAQPVQAPAEEPVQPVQAPVEEPVQPVQAPAEEPAQPVQAQGAGGAGTGGEYIGKDRAKAIALGHAGVGEAAATFVRCELDYDDGRAEYEVEFWSGSTEYDYEINAVTGEITGIDYDAEYHAPQAPSGGAGGAGTGGEYIGTDRAKAIALGHAGLSEADVRFAKCELDREDGRTVYEVDFQSGRVEYEYEIDAVSGSILKSEKDWDD